MVKVRIDGRIATVKNYKWSCDDKNLEAHLQKLSEIVRYERPYGYFSEPAIDNWIGEYMAKDLGGEVLSYNKIDSGDVEPGIIY